MLIFSDRVFGPSTTTEAVYDVAARPVVKGAMEGINGMPILSYLGHHKFFLWYAAMPYLSENTSCGDFLFTIPYCIIYCGNYISHVILLSSYELMLHIVFLTIHF